LNAAFDTTEIRRLNLPFEKQTLLEDSQLVILKHMKAMPGDSSSEEEDSEEMEIREASRALKYKDLDDEPEYDRIARWGVDDFSDDAGSLNDSDGYPKRPQIPREIMLRPTKDLEEVWRQAEGKLGILREHFNLVSNSHYLEQSGQWRTTLERIEIRFRGRGAGPTPQGRMIEIQPAKEITCVHQETGEPLKADPRKCLFVYFFHVRTCIVIHLLGQAPKGCDCTVGREKLGFATRPGLLPLPLKSF
jgi:hypothetical protein